VKGQTALLARNTMWASLASLTQFGVTAVVLALLTFEFEPALFGQFIGALGLVFFVAPFAGLGAPNLLHKRYGADGVSLASALSVARGMVIVGAIGWTLVIIAISFVLLPDVDRSMIAMLALAELGAISYIDACQAVVQATETLRLSVVLKATQSGLRLLALVTLLVQYDDPSLVQWSFLYLVSAVVAAGVAHIVVGRHIGHTHGLALPKRIDIREGFSLTLGWGTERLRTDADKVLLVRFGLGADAGLYGAATRVLQLAYVPIRGAVAASLARFWRGANAPGSPTALAKQLAVAGAGYGLLAGVALAVAAPLLPLVLGSGYDGTTEILLWLTPLPLLIALQSFPATALTSEGHNRERVFIVLGATVLNVILNLALIPGRGWEGAVAATLVTEVLLAGALWVVLFQVVPQPAAAIEEAR